MRGKRVGTEILFLYVPLFCIFEKKHMQLFLFDVPPDPTLFEQVRDNNYILWILGGACLAGLGALLWFIYRRKQREKNNDPK